MGILKKCFDLSLEFRGKTTVKMNKFYLFQVSYFTNEAQEFNGLIKVMQDIT